MSLAKILIISFTLLLSACATAYGPNVLSGGYSDEKIDENTYIVSFNGNGYASEQRVWNFWMYRCAELTLLKGYAFFTLTPIDRNSSLNRDPSDSKAYEFTMLDESDSVARLGDGEGFYQTYVVITYSSRAKVDMYNKPVPEEIKFVFDAETVKSLLGEYVKSNGNNSAKLPPRKDMMLRAAFEAAIKLGRIKKKSNGETKL